MTNKLICFYRFIKNCAYQEYFNVDVYTKPNHVGQLFVTKLIKIQKVVQQHPAIQHYFRIKLEFYVIV